MAFEYKNSFLRELFCPEPMLNNVEGRETALMQEKMARNLPKTQDSSAVPLHRNDTIGNAWN
jgi:hypothetical protein